MPLNMISIDLDLGALMIWGHRRRLGGGAASLVQSAARPAAPGAARDNRFHGREREQRFRNQE